LGADPSLTKGKQPSAQFIKQNFQSEKLGEMEVLYNFNGLSEWQHFNGVSMNQGCGTVNSTDLAGQGSSSGKSTDYYFRDSQVVSH
jgi:hypothetical protein